MKTSFTALLFLTLGSALLEADQLSLNNGDSLTGSVVKIGDGGRVSFDSPNASEPLEFRGSVVSTIEFDFEAPTGIPQTERIHLRNGDILPGEILSLNEEFLDLKTWACGELHIPRSAIASVDFGVAPNDLIFHGPKKESGWTNNENWKFEDLSLVSSSRGVISKPNILPEQFILRFRLDWETNPNFRFFFCDDLLERSGEADRYYFEINTAGLQLKRQAEDSDRRWYPLYSSPRRPDTFPDDGVDVELRVDRQRRLIYIYIDGESEERHHDPIGNIPMGSGIMLESLAGGDMKNIVSSIEIYKWDAVSQIHRNEGHKNPESDAIVTSESERYEGTALGMNGSGEERSLLIKSPHSDEPVRIPLDAVSVLYLRKPVDEEAFPADFSLNLAARGRLAISNPILTPDSLKMSHPLLGDISVRREALMSLQTASKSEPEP